MLLFIYPCRFSYNDTTPQLPVFACTTIFAVSLIYSVTIIGYESADYRRIACFVDVNGSCTGCPDAGESFDSVPYDSVCPEWTDSDVQRVLQVGKVPTLLVIYFC